MSGQVWPSSRARRTYSQAILRNAWPTASDAWSAAIGSAGSASVTVMSRSGRSRNTGRVTVGLPQFGVSLATAAKVATGLQALGLVTPLARCRMIVIASRPPADRARGGPLVITLATRTPPGLAIGPGSWVPNWSRPAERRSAARR